MQVIFNGRPVEIDQVGGTVDEPTVENAFYLDGEEEGLTQDEIMNLEDQFLDELSAKVYESYDKTDDVYERINNR